MWRGLTRVKTTFALIELRLIDLRWGKRSLLKKYLKSCALQITLKVLSAQRERTQREILWFAVLMFPECLVGLL